MAPLSSNSHHYGKKQYNQSIEDGEASNSCHTHPIENEYTFADLAHTIIYAAGIAISELRNGVRLILFGQKKPLRLGDYWMGRPHVYIIQHRDQQDTAQKNEDKFGGAYGWIMARIAGKEPKKGRRFLPENMRSFGDYGAYIASQGTLWVWSKSGLHEDEGEAEQKQDTLIYEQQMQCEVLDYGYMLHRSIKGIAEQYGTAKRVLQARHDLANLETQMAETSVYGEIRDLLANGWLAMGINHLRKAISEILELKQAETSMIERRRSTHWRMILTIVFGLIAVPTLAIEVVKPFWSLFNLWKPENANAAHLFFILVALLLVLIILAISRQLIFKKQTNS